MPVKILHFSDTHERATPEDPGAFFDKRLLGILNSSFIRKNHYDTKRIAPAVEYILAEKPDLVLFTGDATSCGQKGEFERALKDFTPLLESPLPFVYVPGNHDAYVNDPKCGKALKEFTFAMNRGKRTLADYPFVQEFEYFRLLVLHCARPVHAYLSCGVMTEETVRFVQNEAEKSDPRPLLCAGHFPLLHGSSFLNFRRRLYGSGKVRQLVLDHRIALSLCGHIHKPLQMLDERGQGEIVAGSLTKKNLLNKIIFSPEENTFSLERIILSGRN